MRRKIISAILLLLSCQLHAQEKRVAITMDDVPFNAMPAHYTLREIQAANRKLLRQLLQQQTPVAAFINGYDSLATRPALRRQLIRSWTRQPLVTQGNHTLHHRNCAELSLPQFQEEVAANDRIIRMANGHQSVPYFRFPFNSLGKDSLEQAARRHYLQQLGYDAVPFTIESADYVYNALYTAAIHRHDQPAADSIAQAYLDFTLTSFSFYEKLTLEIFHRPIPHIYLCHANLLHADHYTALIAALRARGYQFISLAAALQDPVYASPVYYHGAAGFSWLFRWMPDAAQRRHYLQTSPDPDARIYKAYQAL
ncbi:polysaccharide deacetylase family protein [Chitinophaga nivalis]|uniref:Polysaccharide deacetylase family protein n=1 Tax=Chitinophaga nivalis TaxID=2991709 RepID=A0ABT3IMW5_9BACT|nr:polysaccharide deacetylase family protein [Chitinophaga nivalis]MCW3465244.1 polysaccharide deacetylase family protein [Chitinophaga nivalis]MCW3485064.1 polysaccharide deacetylase family protein [Chitinophaga nivalis]